MKRFTFIAMIATLMMTGCELESEGEGDAGDMADTSRFDPVLLAQYRAAIPSAAQLAAPTPSATSNKALGEAAVYPQAAYPVASGINSAIGNMVTLLEAIVALEPTLYDSETLEFFWGPWDNQDGFGTVAVYIRDMGISADFRYHYALLRGVGSDIGTLEPVIWGASTPDPETDDHGRGITLWDFEANYAFEEDNNPSFATLDLDRGRFVAVYGREMDGDNDVTIVVSVFRDFVPADQPTIDPVDLDYFYGHVVTTENTLDFVSFDANLDVDEETSRSAAEEVSLNLAFLDEGTGRAEAFAEGGDMEESQYATAIECWDDDVLQTYLLLQIWIGSTVQATVELGQESNCGSVFSNSLDDLGIPALGDVDRELLDALDDLATNGVPAQE